jgi:hypothetical protein
MLRAPRQGVKKISLARMEQDWIDKFFFFAIIKRFFKQSEI